MALSYGAAGTITYSTSGGTSVAPTYPSGITTDSALVLIVGQKPITANSGTITTPSGWTLQKALNGSSPGNTGGYTTTLGVDTGNCNIAVYTKDTVSGSESGSLSVTIGQNGVSWGIIFRVQSDKTVRAWAYAADGGTDTSAGNVSIASGAGMDIAAGDLVIGAMVIPTDVNTPTQFSAETMTQTSTTFDTVTEIGEPDSSTQNDIGGFVFSTRAASGGASGTVTMAATAGGTTTNVRGPGVILRLRAAVTNTNTLTDSMTFADSALDQLLLTRVQTDTGVFTDSETHFIPAAGQTYTVTKTDAMSLFDGGVDKEYILNYRDNATLTDSTSKFALRTRMQSDALMLYDDGGTQRTYSVIAETLGTFIDSVIADYVPGGGGGTTYTNTRTDTLTFTDALLKSLQLTRMSSDAMTLVDDLRKALELVRVRTDTMTPTDSALTSRLRQRVVSDVATLIDGTLAQRFLTRQQTDSATLTDATLRSVLRNRTTTDSMTVTDGFARMLTYARMLSDTITFVDTFIKSVIGSGTTYTNTLSDGLTLTDSQFKSLRLSRMLTENLSITDEVQRSLRLTRLITDTVSVIDDFIKSITSSGVVNTLTKTDVLTVLDSTQRSVERNRTATDNVLLIDGTSKTAIRMRQLFDTVIITDDAIKVRWYTRVLADALGVSDELLPTYIPLIEYR